MSRSIILVREDMRRLAEDLRAGTVSRYRAAILLEQYADDTYRRSPLKRAKRERKSLTPALAKAIRAYVARNPHMTNRAIGEVFEVDGGRVSEAMHRVNGY